MVLNAQLHWLIIRLIFSTLAGDLEAARVGSKSPAWPLPGKKALRCKHFEIKIMGVFFFIVLYF